MPTIQRYIVLAVLVALLSLPSLSLADSNTVVLGTNALISLADADLALINNGASVESIDVGASTVTAVLPAGSFINVSTGSRKILSISGGANVVNTCTGSDNAYEVSNTSGSSISVTFTVTSTLCTNPGGSSGGGGGSSGSGSSGGGGGGGGGVSVSSASTQAAAQTLTQTTPQPAQTKSTIQDKIADTLAKVAALQAQIKTLPPGAVPSSAVTLVSSISRPLTIGAAGNQVKALQQVLNADPDTRISASGAGAPGNETTTLGPATLKAIQKFQEKYGIAKKGDEGYGVLGPKTRAKLNQVASKTSATPTVTPATTPSKSSPDIQKQIEDTMAKVKAVQEQLKTLPAKTTPVPTPVPVIVAPVKSTADIQKQIAETLAKVKAVQEQLKTLKP